MKKKIITSIICLCFLIALIVIYMLFKNDNKNDLKKIKVAEVTHSIFYAPQYLADDLGYFEDEGLDVEFILTSGANNVATAVLSGDVQIGLCGSEATIYIYKNGEEDYLVNFAGLTKKDGSFLISRKDEKFDIKNLKGKHIIAGRKAGMPAMTLEYALNINGIKTDEVNFDTSIDFSSTTGAFIGGIGDYVSLFEPSASQIVNSGYGYIVESVGKLGGVVPYTAYNAKKSYIENNKEIIKGFTNAINKALDYIHNNSADEVSKHLTSYFPETSLNELSSMIQRYMDIDSWFETTFISEENFIHIEEIIKNAGEIDDFVPYNDLVNTSFSK